MEVAVEVYAACDAPKSGSVMVAASISGSLHDVSIDAVAGLSQQMAALVTSKGLTSVGDLAADPDFVGVLRAVWRVRALTIQGGQTAPAGERLYSISWSDGTIVVADPNGIVVDTAPGLDWSEAEEWLLGLRTVGIVTVSQPADTPLQASAEIWLGYSAAPLPGDGIVGMFGVSDLTRLLASGKTPTGKVPGPAPATDGDCDGVTDAWDSSDGAGAVQIDGQPQGMIVAPADTPIDLECEAGDGGTAFAWSVDAANATLDSDGASATFTGKQQGLHLVECALGDATHVFAIHVEAPTASPQVPACLVPNQAHCHAPGTRLRHCTAASPSTRAGARVFG